MILHILWFLLYLWYISAEKILIILMCCSKKHLTIVHGHLIRLWSGYVNDYSDYSVPLLLPTWQMVYFLIVRDDAFTENTNVHTMKVILVQLFKPGKIMGMDSRTCVLSLWFSVCETDNIQINKCACVQWRYCRKERTWVWFVIVPFTLNHNPIEMHKT